MIFIEGKFEQVEKEWRDFYSTSRNISPYMSYDFQRIYKRQLWASIHTLRASYVVYKAYENKQLLAIIPMIKIGNRLYIAGDFRATGYLDFLYSNDLTDDQLRCLIKEFISFMKKYKIHFNKINQSSRLFGVLSELCHMDNSSFKRGTCVNISFGESYDDYFSQLSKSTRQNIRTAHNRLNREGKSVSIETHIGLAIDRIANTELMRLYQKRSSERSGKTNKVVQFFQERFNPLTLSLNQSDNSFISTLRIDSELAAYMQGFITQSGEVAVIPRLAINSDFSVYCPGGILITDTIKWLIDNSRVRNLDLSLGDEKYKYEYGGKEHYNFDFSFMSR